jgi:hypothetical protein
MAVFRASGYAALAAVALTGFLATSAQAENKLFPTDVLDKGQIDANVSIGADQATQDFLFISYGQRGSSKSNGQNLGLSARYGLGANWHFGAALSYAKIDAKTRYDGYTETNEEKTSGWQGGGVWAKYGFLDGKTSPLSLSTEVGVTSSTDKNLSYQSFNTAHVQLTGGWDFGHGMKGYSLLNLTVPSRALYNKYESLAVGGWFPISDVITLNPQLGFTHHQASTYTPSFTSTGLGLSAMIRLAGNTYLTPEVSVSKGSGYDTKDGVVHRDSTQITSVSIGLYHLY